MKKINTVEEIKGYISNLKKENKTIGFVPTMGALHEGHVSLVKQCKAENDVCIVSVFVNPTQFNNSEDLKKYPRNPEKDAKLLSKNGCDAVFFPQVEDIYPEGEQSGSFEFNGLENEMEGKFRPGHFDGVATIVNKFFNIIQPDKAYFGEKDFQQLRIIQTLVEKENHSIQIIPMPIFREEDGLAMSSRNERLTPEFRKTAPLIHEFLLKVKELQPTHSVEEINTKVTEWFKESPLELEYFVLSDEKTLKEVQSWDESENIRAFVAVYAGEIRLIDNMKII